MKKNQFFEKQTASSKIKASIVSEYFPQYSKIIVSKTSPEEVRYIDLFAGPGIYEDGSESTPILIAKKCYTSTMLRDKVRMVFNDNQYSQELEKNFKDTFSDNAFAKTPRFGNKTIGQDIGISKFLSRDTHESGTNKYPSLLFIDPFGYKGIETSILAKFLKNWGNEIFIFVNTKRIHPALENDKFEGLMQDLFPSTLSQIRTDRIYKYTVAERLNLIIKSLGEEYTAILGEKVYYTAFKFQEEDSDATSHYILHLTKGSKGYELIKTIYNDFANVGTIFDGVNTYTFDAKKIDNNVAEIFDINSMNIDKLKEEILADFTNKTINASDLFETHHKKNLYSRSHYTHALRRLVDEGKASAVFTDAKEHRVSVLISKECVLEFSNGKLIN